MRVSSYSFYHSYVGKHSMTINVQFETNDFKEGLAFQKMVDVAYKSGQEVDGEQRTITPDKIFRCGDAIRRHIAEDKVETLSEAVEEVRRITQHFKDVLAGIGQIDRA